MLVLFTTRHYVYQKSNLSIHNYGKLTHNEFLILASYFSCTTFCTTLVDRGAKIRLHLLPCVSLTSMQRVIASFAIRKVDCTVSNCSVN